MVLRYKCDHCKDPDGVFGYAPPPGMGILVARSIWVCETEACRAWAKARRAALIAAHDPLGTARTQRAGRAIPPAPAKRRAAKAQDAAQASLI